MSWSIFREILRNRGQTPAKELPLMGSKKLIKLLMDSRNVIKMQLSVNVKKIFTKC